MIMIFISLNLRLRRRLESVPTSPHPPLPRLELGLLQGGFPFAAPVFAAYLIPPLISPPLIYPWAGTQFPAWAG